MSSPLFELEELNFFPPYVQREFLTKRCNLRTFRKSCGVYFIKEDGIPVYVGMSRKTLHSTLYRHFQKWTDNRNSRSIPYMNPPYPRTTYFWKMEKHTYEIAVIECENSHEVEKNYIRKFQPRDNSEKYEFVKRHEEIDLPPLPPPPEEQECPF